MDKKYILKKQIKINILGAGNVATHLAKIFIKHPAIHLQQMYNRHLNKLNEFKKNTEIIDNLENLKPADIFIIALKDDIISEFSQQLKKFDNLIVHTAGSVEMEKLQVKRKGVFYPFQTFSKQISNLDFSKIPILIEAKYEQDLKLLEYLAKLLSKNVQSVNSKQRMALHISGVFVSNFVNRLYIEAAKILQENKLSFDLVKPLIIEVARKVQKISPEKAQTGPAIRGDLKIIDKHLHFLKDKKQKIIYQLLSEQIIKERKKHFE